ncbi:MAG: glycogen/starch synthase [Saprospiraceae bacterium]|nr:glycogen/starch synthase [Saprospiraceae bacterium]
MTILHVSAECYPAAKAGGLGDVVGALPKYLNAVGVETAVIMPKHRTKWLANQDFEVLMQGTVRLGWDWQPYAIEKCLNTSLGYDLYVVNAPQYFDRSGIYTDASGNGFYDEVERSLTFQQAVIHWVMGMVEKPKVIHCHDHHTGLLPFMMQYCPEYVSVSQIPTVFTIHNGQYQGAFSWKKAQIMPFYQAEANGLLDWNNTINPMASAIKCAWRFTTVSPGYLDELKANSGGLEWLINSEIRKSAGILNGIDAQVWDPQTDPMLAYNLADSDVDTYKNKNKEVLAQMFGVNPNLPIITFIGRAVGEKGADLLPELYGRYLAMGGAANFIFLGTGDPSVTDALTRLAYQFPDKMGVMVDYNEKVSHQLYAGSDFLIMPSRVEPCGLNQMYSLRYGTVPIVRSIGGLRDTVIDIASPDGGSGIRFNNFSIDDAMMALHRSMRLWWDNKAQFLDLRRRIMTIDNSWEYSTQQYLTLYNQIANF